MRHVSCTQQYAVSGPKEPSIKVELRKEQPNPCTGVPTVLTNTASGDMNFFQSFPSPSTVSALVYPSTVIPPPHPSRCPPPSALGHTININATCIFLPIPRPSHTLWPSSIPNTRAHCKQRMLFPESLVTRVRCKHRIT